jgi:hypothetical protein
MSVSRGFAECSPDTTMTPDELILVADKEMYRHKQGNTLEG